MDNQEIENVLQNVENILCKDFEITKVTYMNIGLRTTICLATHESTGTEIVGHACGMKREDSSVILPAVKLIALNNIHKQLLAAHKSRKAMEVNTIFSLVSSKNGRIILEFKDNADIYYDGKLIANEEEIVKGFRDFLSEKGII